MKNRLVLMLLLLSSFNSLMDCWSGPRCRPEKNSLNQLCPLIEIQDKSDNSKKPQGQFELITKISGVAHPKLNPFPSQRRALFENMIDRLRIICTSPTCRVDFRM